MGCRMNPFVTRTTSEISLLKNQIIQLRAQYKQETNKEQRAILRIRINAYLEHYQELTKPFGISTQQVG